MASLPCASIGLSLCLLGLIGPTGCSQDERERSRLFAARGGAGGQTGLVLPDESGGGGASATDTPLQEAPDCSGVDVNLDTDGDGLTTAAGDCNDCTKLIQPAALDAPGNNIDEDCNGAVDDGFEPCDGDLAIDSLDARDAARAMGLCKDQAGLRWGVISARYVGADGQPLSTSLSAPLGHGILQGFGPNVNPQEGAKLLALSSGAARTPSDPDYFPPLGFAKGYYVNPPQGFPKDSPECPGVTVPSAPVFDSIGLEVKLKTPSSAKAIRFNLNFYTYEFPEYYCTLYNDFFVSLLSPKPAAQADSNISFDAKGNLISVNSGFVDICTPQVAGSAGATTKYFACSKGPANLLGTGFDENAKSASTGWLETMAPIENPGGEITLLFTIWDTGDPILDSTILLDNFRFDVMGTAVATEPVAVPK